MDEKGWNQETLADKIGISQPAISNMLNRHCRPQNLNDSAPRGGVRGFSRHRLARFFVSASVLGIQAT